MNIKAIISINDLSTDIEIQRNGKTVDGFLTLMNMKKYISIMR